MAQIPVSQNTFKRLNLLKAKSIEFLNGETVSWDKIMEVMCSIVENNNEKFKREIKGESMPEKVKELKEKINKGEMVKSSDLEEAMKKKTLKEEGEN